MSMKASVDDIENIDPVLTARVVAVLAPFALARDPKFGTEGPSSHVEANLLAAAFLDAAHSIPNGGLFIRSAKSHSRPKTSLETLLHRCLSQMN